MCTQGSPPRVRGKGGKAARTRGNPWDHPRVCGEKDSEKGTAERLPGSPPRVRGKALSSTIKPNTARITPACAGKSLLRNQCVPDRRGSPPRVRGKVGLVLYNLRPGRITPACAGKRPRHGERVGAAWDHPRVCGEKLFIIAVFVIAMGSPPRVRGKEVTIPMTGNAPRITPACAGKSSRIPLHLHWTGDHPRVCGEKTKKIP